MTAWLGVDGGGTKTALALVDDDGRLLGRTTAATTYHLGDPRGPALVGDVLRPALAALHAAAGTAPGDVGGAVVGLPGYGEVPGDVPLLRAVVQDALGAAPATCVNDAVCGWAGSLGGADGVNVVAGTGSIAYGRRGDREARAGGWSELFGDEGSAYWVATRALAAFSRGSDGRAPAPGPLGDLLRAFLHLREDLELVDVVVNRWAGDRGRIAGLARLVDEAAEAGDPDARAVLERAGAHLALLVGAVRRRLGAPADEVVAVAWSGGVFASTTVRGAFTASLRAPHRLQRPLLAPDAGAAVHAARLAGRPLDPDAVRRLAPAPDPNSHADPAERP